MSKQQPTLSCKGQAYKYVKTSKNGRTAGEIYRHLHNYSQRGVRLAISELTRDKFFKVSKCRCGHSPIYHVRI